MHAIYCIQFEDHIIIIMSCLLYLLNFVFISLIWLIAIMHHYLCLSHDL